MKHVIARAIARGNLLINVPTFRRLLRFARNDSRSVWLADIKASAWVRAIASVENSVRLRKALLDNWWVPCLRAGAFFKYKSTS